METDLYKTLGVPRTASPDDIRKAYRKLAKTLHPDLHPNDAVKQERFKAVSAANDILGDPEKRRRYDAGEIDAAGQERPERQFYHHYAGQNAGRRHDPRHGHGVGEEDLSDIFAHFFGGHGGARARDGFRQGDHGRGQDLRYRLDIGFLEAARGVKRRVTVQDGKSLEISIPAGVKDGQTLRLRGKGAPAAGHGKSGDALVTVAVAAHPVFTRDGDNVIMELPITFDEAVLGARVDVPTISGSVTVTVPKAASSGQRLRLRGKGIRGSDGKSGDQIVRLKIVLPEQLDEELETIARQWRDKAGFDPRKELRRVT